VAGGQEPVPEHQRCHADKQGQHGRPEPAKAGGEPRWRQEHREPRHGEAYLEWKHDPCLAEEHALLPTGESGGDRCLGRVGKTAASSDRLAHPRSGRVAEAIVEGERPFRVASLPDPVVHRWWTYRILGHLGDGMTLR
jgi:hypothetical protein